MNLEAIERLAALQVAERSRELDTLRQANRHGYLPQDKLPHAAYLLARHIDGRPVEGGDLDRLRRADDTVIETRCRLSVGRSNVDVDIDRTAHDSSRRLYAGRELAATQLATGAQADEHLAVAAAALFLRAGNCMEYANAALALHAARQGPDETALTVVPDSVDHRFVELHTGQGREHDVVVDPWADGPAIMAPDGYFSTVPRLRELARVGPADAPSVSASVEQGLDQMRVRWSHAVDGRLAEMEQAGMRYSGHVYGLTGVMSEEFLARVRKGLDRQATLSPTDGATFAAAISIALDTLLGRRRKSEPLGPLRNEIRAVGIARAAGSSIASAAEGAPDIIEALRRHTER